MLIRAGMKSGLCKDLVRILSWLCPITSYSAHVSGTDFSDHQLVSSAIELNLILRPRFSINLISKRLAEYFASISAAFSIAAKASTMESFRYKGLNIVLGNIKSCREQESQLFTLGTRNFQ